LSDLDQRRLITKAQSTCLYLKASSSHINNEGKKQICCFVVLSVLLLECK